MTVRNGNHASSAGWSLSPRELTLIFLFWTFLASLSAVNRIMDPRAFGLRDSLPPGPILFLFGEAWLWALLTPLIFWLCSRFDGEKASWLVSVPALLVIGLVVAFVVDFGLDLLRSQLIPISRRRGGSFGFLRGMGRFRIFNHLLIYLGILAAGFAREYFLRDQSRQREADSLQAEASRLQAQLADARLETLRMQLNPHFLFNTLHAISALVERDPSGVRRMIARLSELLRHTVESRGSQEVTLREELEMLERYLDIMRVRFQGRLDVSTEIDPQTLDALVPNLILQPIIENALEHGVNRISGAGKIEIRATLEDQALVITIRDNGAGLDDTASRASREGVGLGNSRARLQQLYGESGQLTLRAAEAGGVVAEIRIPYHNALDLRTTGLSTGEAEG